MPVVSMSAFEGKADILDAPKSDDIDAVAKHVCNWHLADSCDFFRRVRFGITTRQTHAKFVPHSCNDMVCYDFGTPATSHALSST